MKHTLLIFCSCLLVSLGTLSGADFEKAALPFLQEHCLRCHDDKKQKGQLRIDTLSRDFAQPGAAGRWADVIEKIHSKEMPPEDEKQPSVTEAARFVEALNEMIKDGEAARLAKREAVSLRKLTREEYAHTLRDLLGVHYDATDPNGLTEDPEWNGFERLGSVLTLAPSHIQKYMAAAQTVLAEALPEKRPEVMKLRRSAYEMSGGPADWKRAVDGGFAEKVRYEVWPNWFIRRGAPPHLAADGVYRMRIKLSGLRPEGGEAPHLVVYAENLDRVLFEQDVIVPEDKPVTLEFTTHLPAGTHQIFLRNEASGPSLKSYSARAGSAYSPYFSTQNTGRQPWQNKLTDEDAKPLWPFLLVDWIEWEGPLLEGGTSFAEGNYVPADTGDRAQVSAAVSRFAERAFRRPVEPHEVERLMKIYEGEVAAGEKPRAALKTTMVSALCAKDFLHLVEGAPERTANRLTDWELASRLSYFLWSTMPDEALFAAARDSSLHRPEVLKAQFTRMMADTKARRFAETFPRNWLQLRKLGTFPPDKVLYPDYSKHLEKSMARETTAFFREVLEKNLTQREFLHSDWTMLNGRLAQHYKLPGVEGDEFRRVALRPEDHRGGLLTQGSVLSLTSDGTRHRPVHRGKWLVESILGKPVPPPPGNVEPIPTTPPEGRKATLRNKLDAHKSDKSCAECHRKIDPLGFAFDNYDAIGRWRTEEVVNDGTGANPPVDASGVLSDGRRFTDAVEFKHLLLGDLDKFNAALTEKLAMFALRRTMTLDDRAALARIAAQSQSADYSLRALVEALVLSDLFQQR